MEPIQGGGSRSGLGGAKRRTRGVGEHAVQNAAGLLRTGLRHGEGMETALQMR